jgi:hypothetical protein
LKKTLPSIEKVDLKRRLQTGSKKKNQNNCII